jgi:hypothetical protein
VWGNPEEGVRDQGDPSKETQPLSRILEDLVRKVVVGVLSKPREL